MSSVTAITEKLEEIKDGIKNYVDFPKPGVIFRDIFPLFQEPKLINNIIMIMTNFLSTIDVQIDVIAGIESRGFLFAVPLSLHLNVPFVPIRKKGKLPGETENVTFQLEYGTDTIEVQKNAIEKGQKVAIVDDLLATGGTIEGTCKLVEKVGGTIASCLFLIELLALKGSSKIKYPMYSLIKYP